MRTIKFRAWDSDKNQMILPDYSDWDDFFIEPDGIVYRSFETGTYETYRTKREARNLTVMQFTGLKDKNGKDIWEGDIINSSWEELYLIIWYGSGWKMKSIEHKTRPSSIRGKRNYVIGNCYENPELLKQLHQY